MRSITSKYGEQILIALGLTLIAFLALDLIAGHSETRTGIVVDKFYKPERHWYTLETRHYGKRSVTELVHHRTPPSWQFLIKISTEDVVWVDCRASRFYQTTTGALVPFKTYYGGYTGIPWSRDAL